MDSAIYMYIGNTAVCFRVAVGTSCMAGGRMTRSSSTLN